MSNETVNTAALRDGRTGSLLLKYASTDGVPDALALVVVDLIDYVEGLLEQRPTLTRNDARLNSASAVNRDLDVL